MTLSNVAIAAALRTPKQKYCEVGGEGTNLTPAIKPFSVARLVLALTSHPVDRSCYSCALVFSVGSRDLETLGEFGTSDSSPSNSMNTLVLS